MGKSAEAVGAGRPMSLVVTPARRVHRFLQRQNMRYQVL